MRILDENNVEMTTPDLELGYLQETQIFKAHHPSIAAVAEQGHWNTVAEYPNGGKDVEWVVDVEAVEAAEAWDEYEEIYRYILYTAEELAQREAEREEAYRKSPEYRIGELEAALELLLSGVTE